MYTTLKKIQEMLWREDDLMSQDTLFELQEFVADVILDVAKFEGDGKVDDLVKSFPWLYVYGTK